MVDPSETVCRTYLLKIIEDTVRTTWKHVEATRNNGSPD